MSAENDDKDSWWKKVSSGVSSLYEKGSANVQDQLKTIMDSPKPGAKSDKKNDESSASDEQMLEDMEKIVRQMNEEITRMFKQMMANLLESMSSNLSRLWGGSAAGGTVDSLDNAVNNESSLGKDVNNELPLDKGVDNEVSLTPIEDVMPAVNVESPSPSPTQRPAILEPDEILKLDDLDDQVDAVRDRIAFFVDKDISLNAAQKLEVNTILNNFNDPSFSRGDKINCLSAAQDKIESFYDAEKQVLESPSALSTAPEPTNTGTFDLEGSAAAMRDNLAGQVEKSTLFSDDQKLELNALLDTIDDPSVCLSDKVDNLQSVLDKMDDFHSEVRLSSDEMRNTM